MRKRRRRAQGMKAQVKRGIAQHVYMQIDAVDLSMPRGCISHYFMRIWGQGIALQSAGRKETVK